MVYIHQPYIVLHEPSSSIPMIRVVSIKLILILHDYALNLLKRLELEFFRLCRILIWLCGAFFVLWSFLGLLNFRIDNRNNETGIFIIIFDRFWYLLNFLDPIIRFIVKV